MPNASAAARRTLVRSKGLFCAGAEYGTVMATAAMMIVFRTVSFIGVVDRLMMFFRHDMA
jgi:hypothetical protein